MFVSSFILGTQYKVLWLVKYLEGRLVTFRKYDTHPVDPVAVALMTGGASSGTYVDRMTFVGRFVAYSNTRTKHHCRGNLRLLHKRN